jgi:predicted GNAT family N-acyltransferase
MPKIRIDTARFDTTPGIRRVRDTVFVREQAVPLELEWDGEDPHALHVIALDPDDEVVGTGRLLPDGHIGRMAVLPDWRRQGVGTALLQALLEEATRAGLSRVFLHAQTSAVDFYARYGFIARGEEFMDAGIPHYYMERDLGS